MRWFLILRDMGVGNGCRGSRLWGERRGCSGLKTGTHFSLVGVSSDYCRSSVGLEVNVDILYEV